MENERYNPKIKKHSKTIKKRLVSFNPNISAKKAIEILKKANVEKYALIGGVAMWVHIEDETIHQFTKDIDIAVPYKNIESIEQAIKESNLHYMHLNIGGLGIRENEIYIDFIDRHIQVEQLFLEALEASTQNVEIDDEIQMPVVPVEYLIAMKMVSGEPKDDIGVKHLLKNVSIDYEKAKDITVNHLGEVTGNRLDVFARDVGLLPELNEYYIK
ncbi:nucleotidyl transferase AbiEii/AbiGii toxin family protein [Deltaproteobacteria bacterium TL4]